MLKIKPRSLEEQPVLLHAELPVKPLHVLYYKLLAVDELGLRKVTQPLYGHTAVNCEAWIPTKPDSTGCGICYVALGKRAEARL